MGMHFQTFCGSEFVRHSIIVNFDWDWAWLGHAGKIRELGLRMLRGSLLTLNGDTVLNTLAESVPYNIRKPI